VNEEQSVWIRVEAKEAEDENENDDEDDWGGAMMPGRR
jgi:hypothetical protein